MTEPDVALTDYGLAIECGVFLYLVYRGGLAATSLGAPLILFFGAAALASLAGGTVHGFFLDVETMGHLVLWRITLIAIGATALSAWALGARMQFAPRAAQWITTAAGAAFLGYTVLVLFMTQDFQAAVFFYLPAAVFLLAVLSVQYARGRERRILVALSGLGLTFVAAAVQQSGIALHPTYFNHNALYHLIQAVALWLLFLGFRAIAASQVKASAPC